MFFSGLIILIVLANSEVYCPTQNDFSYSGNIQWSGNGWRITASGGVHGKTAFNLLGGFVQFDIDTSGAQGGVNNNFYTSSPAPGLFPSYCDIQSNDSPVCMEMDIVENNGNCFSQVTWHTWPNHNGGCDQNGCWGSQYASGYRTMRAEFNYDGSVIVTIGGNRVYVTNPTPSSSEKAYIAQQTRDVGLQFHSTQWVGWVPGSNCAGGGNLDGSVFAIKNLVVSGSVVQGNRPTRCYELEDKYYHATMASLNKTRSWFESETMDKKNQEKYSQTHQNLDFNQTSTIQENKKMN